MKVANAAKGKGKIMVNKDELGVEAGKKKEWKKINWHNVKMKNINEGQNYGKTVLKETIMRLSFKIMKTERQKKLCRARK